MVRSWTAIGAAMALWAASCPGTTLAQPVFFDDFDGPDLLPHWRTPDPTHWEYNVSGGMLNVTGLFYPGIPHLGGNFAATGALFEAQTDFRLDAWMGWDEGDMPHGISVEVRGPGGSPIIAGFRYANDGSDPLGPFLSAGGVTMPAPPPGMYQFTIQRLGSQFEYYFDGEFFASVPDRFGTPAGGVVFSFLGPNPPGSLGALHVDRIRIVPAPSALTALGVLGFTFARRRRA